MFVTASNNNIHVPDKSALPERDAVNYRRRVYDFHGVEKNPTNTISHGQQHFTSTTGRHVIKK